MRGAANAREGSTIPTISQTIESLQQQRYPRVRLGNAYPMKLIRILILFIWCVLILVGCKKDYRDGLFEIKPEDFLDDKKYGELVVEVCYVDGHKPEQASLDNLQAFLSARLNKPRGISFAYKSIPSPGNSLYDQADLEELEKDFRTQFTKRKKLTAWVFFADAGYSNPGVLGLQYGNTSCAIFEKTIEENSGAIGQPSQVVLETTVLEHEFGHLMGLVDARTDMVSAHAANGKHCDNQNCLMYYAVETLDFIGNLVGGEIPELDQNCIADLQANGGK